MTERFFAPCPRGLEAALAAELGRSARADVARHRRRRRVRRRPRSSRIARTSSRGSRAASCGASAAAAYRDERRALRARRTRSTGSGTSRPTRTLRVDVAATRSPLHEPRVRDAPASRTRSATAFAPTRGVRPSIDKRAPDVRVHALPDRARGDALPRHLRRAAVQARLPARRRRGAAAREPRRRPARARRLDAGHAVARPDVRQRDDRRSKRR